MAGTRGVVLAAGRGLRMGGGAPKTLAPVPMGEPLLHYILSGLERAGIDDLVVVTGHRAGDIEAYVSERWSHEVTYVFNPRYGSWGNFHSVRVAIDRSPGASLLVVNSDVIIVPDAYRRVAAATGDLVLAVERRQRLDDEDMKVQLDGGAVRDIGKGLKRARSHAEFVGVSLIRPPAARAYADAASALEWRADTHLYYEDVYRLMLGSVAATSVEVVAGQYAEVDVPEDMDAVARVVELHAGEWDEAEAARS